MSAGRRGASDMWGHETFTCIACSVLMRVYWWRMSGCPGTVQSIYRSLTLNNSMGTVRVVCRYCTCCMRSEWPSAEGCQKEGKQLGSKEWCWSDQARTCYQCFKLIYIYVCILRGGSRRMCRQMPTATSSVSIGKLQLLHIESLHCVSQIQWVE